MQECGECTECCTAFPVVELKKPAGKACTFSDKGCKIYDSRPQSCKDCLCAWITQPSVGKELRPDRCGVIFERIGDSTMLATIVGPINKHIHGQILSFKQQGYEVRVNR